MKDNLEHFFSETNFDVYEPKSGHKSRFLERLQKPKKKSKSLVWIGVAASILLFIGFLGGKFYQNQPYDLRNISSEMAETQDFFTASIHTDLREVNKYRNPQNSAIIDDAISNLEDLEKDYKVLRAELKTTDNQKIIILNMIRNYQQRLEILQNVLKILEEQKNQFHLKPDSYEII